MSTYIFENRRTEYVPYEKEVHEYKAPTDESIKLYDEMKEKAYQSILRSVKIQDNVINLSGIVYSDVQYLSTVFKYTFTLNGVSFDGTIEVSDLDYNDDYELVKKCYESLSKDIAVLLIKKTDFKKVIRKTR